MKTSVFNIQSMNRKDLYFYVALALSLSALGAALLLFFQPQTAHREWKTVALSSGLQPLDGTGAPPGRPYVFRDPDFPAGRLSLIYKDGIFSNIIWSARLSAIPPGWAEIRAGTAGPDNAVPLHYPVLRRNLRARAGSERFLQALFRRGLLDIYAGRLSRARGALFLPRFLLKNGVLRLSLPWARRPREIREFTEFSRAVYRVLEQ